MSSVKPLGRKSYGSIPHLPNSRLGPGDYHCHEGQARIATEKARDSKDVIIVQEKLDGSNVGVCKVNGQIIPITRAGYVANTSPYEQHHLFYDWALQRKNYFSSILQDGERVCGEWIAQAHGTLYSFELLHAPFIVFDKYNTQNERKTYHELRSILANAPNDISIAHDISIGVPVSVDHIMSVLNECFDSSYGCYDAMEPVEGAVWRVERDGKVDFVVKYVRPDKVDGKYLPEVSGKPAVWNWRPN